MLESHILTLLLIFLVIISLLGGLVVYLYVRSSGNQANSKIKYADLKANLIEKNNLEFGRYRLELEKEFQEKEILLNGKKLIEIEKLEIEKRDLNNDKKDLLKKEEEFLNKQNILTTQKEELSKARLEFEQKQIELDNEKTKISSQYIENLEKISGISKIQARKIIVEEVEKSMGEELLSWQNKFLGNFEEIAFQKAKEITVLAVQRCSSEVANEFTLTTIKLENDEDKGKLIGKGGRNIQWLEKTLGVELIIDDTPGIVTVSGFSSVRRHIAKKTLEKLLSDGRVHPATIEEMYEKAKNEIAAEIAEAGQWAVNELGIYDFPAKLIRTIGRLTFRTGYGQNVLKHSVEMAKLAGLLADGINSQFPTMQQIDRMICIKGALLHDVGKGVDEDMTPKGNHIEIGEKLCDLFDLDWRIKKCISSHHTTGGDRQSYTNNETGQVCFEAAIVDACDTLSGGRPGARKETVEAYFQRMEALENVANKIEGVKNSWIMRGARELWVFFDANKLTPAQAHKATRKLAVEINENIKTPQEIKVIGFREDRVVEYTR